MIDEKKLDELDALAKAATPGPWGYAYTGSGDYEVTHESPQEYPIASIWRSYKESHAEYKSPEAADPKFIAAMNPSIAAELIRLARLGLWAEKYGVAAVKVGLDNTQSDFCSHSSKPEQAFCSFCEPMVVALAALPKKSNP